MVLILGTFDTIHMNIPLPEEVLGSVSVVRQRLYDYFLFSQRVKYLRCYRQLPRTS